MRFTENKREDKVFLAVKVITFFLLIVLLWLCFAGFR